MSTGQWIRDRRIAAGLSQAALAREIGVNQPFISLWERGVYEPPASAMKKIRKILGKVKVKARAPVAPPEAPEPEPTPEELQGALANLPGGIGHLHIPGEVARRDYAVFLLLATHRESKERLCFVGHTGDPHEGCQPILSSAGSHFSHDLDHARMRDRLGNPEEYDFDYFYATFGGWTDLSDPRSNVDTIQEMERQLSVLAQEAFGEVTRATFEKPRAKKGRTERLAPPVTRVQKARLQALVDEVKRFVDEAPEP